MSYEWIKTRVSLHEQPEIFILCRITKLDKFAVVGRLQVLWSYAQRHATRSGFLKGLCREWLDSQVNHSGFAEAMEECGWLEVYDGKGLMFPGHEKWHTKQERTSNAERQARYRQNKKLRNAVPPTSEKTSGENCDKNERNALRNSRNESNVTVTLPLHNASLSYSCSNSSSCFCSSCKEKSFLIQEYANTMPETDEIAINLISEMCSIRRQHGLTKIAITSDLRCKASDAIGKFGPVDLVACWKWKYDLAERVTAEEFFDGIEEIHAAWLAEKTLHEPNYAGYRDDNRFHPDVMRILRGMNSVSLANNKAPIVLTGGLKQLSANALEQLSEQFTVDDLIETWSWVQTTSCGRIQTARKSGNMEPANFLRIDDQGLRAAIYFGLMREEKKNPSAFTQDSKYNWAGVDYDKASTFKGDI